MKCKDITLKVTNVKQLQGLLQKATDQMEQLNKTLDQIQRFETNVTVNKLKS